VLRGNLRRALALVRRRTHRGPALAVTLYERPDCELCAETHRALRRISLDRPLEIERVDISGNSELTRRYALRVPVLLVGDRELDGAGLDDAALAGWLLGVAPVGAPPASADGVREEPGAGGRALPHEDQHRTDREAELSEAGQEGQPPGPPVSPAESPYDRAREAAEGER
jgi:glutaredoxin